MNDWVGDRIEVDGIALHARTRTGSASRPVVVFVHGLLVSSRYMRPTARCLWDEADVWAPDMPGFGRSESIEPVLDVPGLATWLGRWLEARQLADVVMVANSFGCQYAADLVARDPSRVRALVLTGPTMDPARRTALRQAARWTANAVKEPPSLGLVVARDLVDCGLRRAAVTYRHGLADPIEAKLPRISVPTVVMRGSRDVLVTQRWANEATSLLPEGRLVVVPGAAHTLTYNSGAAVAEVVRRLL